MMLMINNNICYVIFYLCRISDQYECFHDIFNSRYVRLLIFSIISHCLNIHANIAKTCNIHPYNGYTAEWGRQRSNGVSYIIIIEDNELNAECAQ